MITVAIGCQGFGTRTIVCKVSASDDYEAISRLIAYLEKELDRMAG